MHFIRLAVVPVIIALGLSIAASLVAVPRESGTDPPIAAPYMSNNFPQGADLRSISGDGETYSIEFVGYVPFLTPAIDGVLGATGSEGRADAPATDRAFWGWRPFITTDRVTTATDG
jgi:hypothetical protein